MSVAREIPPPSARTLPPLSSRRFALLVALLTLVALALRAATMTAQNLWYDEIETARIAILPFGDLLRGLRGELPLLPTAWLSALYFLVLRAALLVPGLELEAALRLVSVLAGTATVPALAWTARPLVGARAAVAATFILALSPFHIWYSQEVRPYALLVLLAVLAIGCVHRALRGHAAAWVGFAIATVLALYTHPTALALPVIAGLTLLVAARRDPATLRRGIITLALVGVAFLPAVVMVRARGANNIPDPRGISALDVPYAFYAYVVGFSLGPSSTELHLEPRAALGAAAPLIGAVAVLFGVLALAGLVAVLTGRIADGARDEPYARADGARGLPPAERRRATLSDADRVLVLAWLVAPFAMAVLSAFATRNPLNPRYAIIAFPALVLVLGAGVWRLAALAPRRMRLVAAAVLALVAVVSGWSVYNLATDVRYAKEDCRALATLLSAEARSGDLVLVSARYMESAVRFYYGGPAEVVGYDPPDAPDARERTATELEQLIDGHPRVWLVRARAFHGDRHGLVPSLLNDRLDPGPTRAFPGVDVQRFATR